MELRATLRHPRRRRRRWPGSGSRSRRARQDYAAQLWDYWEREMEPDSGRGRSLKERARRTTVMITGASLGHRALDRAEGRRRRRHPAARGAQRRRSSRRPARRSSRRAAPPTSTRPTSPTWSRSKGCSSGCSPTTARRHAGQQRRPLDPPLDRAQLRPLPRLRADDPAQLLRRDQADHGAAAAHARARLGPHRQRLLDRRADQPAALLRLRRLQGRARRLDPRGGLRGDRRRRHLHDASTCRSCARR